MALRFLDGFDHYVTADVAKKWDAHLTGTAANFTVQAGAGRRSTPCGRWTTVTGSGGSEVRIIRVFDNQDTWILGMALALSGYPPLQQTLFEWRDGPTTQVDVRLENNGTLSLTRNGTFLGNTSANALPTGSYTYVEWRLVIANSGSTELRFNGVSVLTLSGVDTLQTTFPFANTLRLGVSTRWSAVSSFTVDVDDLYVCDGTGAAPHNTFLGDCRVDALLANAEGSTQQWTPSTGTAHYPLVDDTEPNTTDYVESFTPTQRELFGMQDLSAMTGTIYGVQLGLAVSKPDAGGRNIQGVIRSGSSEVLGTAKAVSSSQLYMLQMQTTDPATAAAWTESGINSVQVGAEVV